MCGVNTTIAKTCSQESHGGTVGQLCRISAFQNRSGRVIPRKPENLKICEGPRASFAQSCPSGATAWPHPSKPPTGPADGPTWGRDGATSNCAATTPVRFLTVVVDRGIFRRHPEMHCFNAPRNCSSSRRFPLHPTRPCDLHAMRLHRKCIRQTGPRPVRR